MVACPVCQFDNREGRRFCAECGGGLAVACAGCGAVNEPGAKFCGSCGLALTAAVPSPAASRARVGERRQVSIMYVDLSGYTQLSELLDAEELHTTTGRVLDTVDRTVADYGGTVHRHVGDAVMALFGVPAAHGDDPYRAVAGALAIHAAIGVLGAELGRDLAVHIGIANGEVVVAEQGEERPKDVPEYAVTGVAANLASRLNGMAAPRETIVSDGIQRAVERHVDCESLGAVEVKGLKERVVVWRATALRAADNDRPRGNLVGRRAEMIQFDGTLHACGDAEAGQAILLRGQAGYGKTRLVEEFEALARRLGFACHKGLVLDFGAGKGRDAVASLIGSLLGLPATDDAAARQAALSRAMDDGLCDTDAQVFINDLLGLPQPVALRGVYDAMSGTIRAAGRQAAVTDIVRRLSYRQPRLLTVEDIHWADAATLDYLARMAAAVQDCPAVLVMTSRIEGDPLGEDWRAAAGGPLTTMDLGPLRDREAVELAGQLSNRSDDFTRSCIERAAGCPLFLEQLLRQAEDVGEEGLPSTVQSLVLARVDKLAEPDKLAMQAASIIGQRFSLDALRAVVGDPAYSCAALVRQFLIRPEGQDYLFAHALIREGVYASLLRPARNRLHRKAAAWFAENDAALHAEHLDRAADPAAPQAYLAAARLQSQDCRNDRALVLAEQGLSIARQRSDICGLGILRGEVLHDLGQIAESMVAYEAALDAAEAEDDRCRARIGLAAGMRMVDRYDGALAQLDAAEADARALGMQRELAQIHHLRGNLYFPLGNIERCIAEHGAAHRLASAAGLVVEEIRALGGLGDAAYAQGRLRSAHDYFVRCCALSRQHGVGRIEAANQAMAAITGYYTLDIDGAFDEAERAVAFGVRVGHPRAEIIARHAICIGHLLRGELALARAAVEAAQVLTLRLGARRFEPENLMFLAEIAILEGDRPGALCLLEQAMAISRETSVGYVGPAILGVTALATDDPVQRAAALAEGEALLAAGALSHNVFWFRAYAIEAALLSGDLAGAEWQAAALATYTASEPLPLANFIIARGRLLVAWQRGLRGKRVSDEASSLIAEAKRVGLRQWQAALVAIAETG